jgi:hypothetical protein
MTARGKHETGKDSKPTSDPKHVNRHGGPQTGNGYTATGRKPKAEEIKYDES